MNAQKALSALSLTLGVLGTTTALGQTPAPAPTKAAAAVQTPECPAPLAPPTPDMLQEGLKNAKDRGFLWRATKDGRSSYLYGTIHVARFEWAFPGPAVQAALREADTLALELDPLDPATGAKLQELMAPKPTQTLAPDVRAKLVAVMKASCLPETLLSAMAPEMVAATLSIVVAKREGLEAEYGIDTVLAGFGRGAKKPVAALETAELQMKALLATSSAEVETMVKDAISELESGEARKVLARLANAWSKSDLAELETYDKWCECIETDQDRALMKRMLDDRNPGMAQGIDALHTKGQRVFGAVGSLHMIGPQGLPALLAKRGYVVERVKF